MTQIGFLPSHLDLHCLHRYLFRCRGLNIDYSFQRNVGLRKLNLSWNGFGQDGCLALGQAMKENRTLKELDVASNRLTVTAVGGLMKGIQENDGLLILRVSEVSDR